MTPARMRECLAALGWGQRYLAERLNIDEGGVRKMARGKKAISVELETWLEAAAAPLLTQPMPQGWRAPPPFQDDLAA